MQNTKLNSEKMKYKKIVVYMVVIFIMIVLIYDAAATAKLNHKYTEVVNYDTGRRRYCEINGNEYIMSGKCNMMTWHIFAAVQIFNVYYDEEHRNVAVTLEMKEDKLGRREYKIGFDTADDDKWGGYVYLDPNGNFISKYGEAIDEKAVEIMKNLDEEVQRVIELANSKWNVGISLSEP